MKRIDTSECEAHILVCTNERPEPKSSCKKVGGQEFYDKLKQKLKSEGYYDRFWVTRSGCLGFCNNVGTTVAIYRRGSLGSQSVQWYNEVTESDFDFIWQEIVKPS